jgi:arylformamidase
MKLGRIVELSHTLYPEREEYKLQVTTFPVTKLFPKYKSRSEDNYIMSEVTFETHCGTHVEVPYHYIKGGKDVADFPIEKLVGEATVLDFTHKQVDEPITADDFKTYDSKIQKGDIVFIKTGYDRNYRTDKAHDRPYITLEATEWLVEKGIHCLGTDCTGIEEKGQDCQAAHCKLFENDIPLIEYVTNLGALRKERFLAFILPWKVRSLEASPVRIIAIESEE